MLYCYVGERKSVNKTVLTLACDSTPSVVIDCANAADPHELVHNTNPDTFDSVLVYHAEMLYLFRDILANFKEEAKTIAITTPDRVFAYDNQKENIAIMNHIIELLQSLQERYDIHIAIARGSSYEILTQWGTPQQVKELSLIESVQS